MIATDRIFLVMLGVAATLLCPDRSSAGNPLRETGGRSSLRRQIEDEARIDVGGSIRRAGFFGGCDNGCGAACDCDPGCGVEEVVCGAEEVVCGVEEVGCGVEVGCGIGEAMEHIGIGEVVCGIEAPCGQIGCDTCSIGFTGGCDAQGIGGCDACGVGGCDGCGGDVGVKTLPLHIPFLRVDWNRFDFFGGVSGFTNPLSFANVGDARRDHHGNFGFHVGFNESRMIGDSLWGYFDDMAVQLGARFIIANLDDSPFTNESRQQAFVTGGVFRRVDYGLQYGTAIDYLNEDWYFTADLVQSRSEVSWRFRGPRVAGLQYITSWNDDDVSARVVTDDGSVLRGSGSVETIDQYRLFYRRLLGSGGRWQAFGGWTDDDDGLLGADATIPISQKMALQTGFTYLIPGNDTRSFEREAWNLSMGLVYRPGGPCGVGRYARAMFDVADNGTMIGRRR